MRFVHLFFGLWVDKLNAIVYYVIINIQYHITIYSLCGK